MGRAAEIDVVLSVLDTTLEPLGFHRRKRTQEWTRSLDTLHKDIVHVNFGLAIINLSVAVEYQDIVDLAPRDHASCHASEMLAAIVPRPRQYELGASAVEMAGDVVAFGIPFIDKLHDRGFVIERLLNESPTAWCAYYSDRIRLLPLQLASSGRLEEALEFVKAVLPEAEGRDQRRPGYRAFAAWFLTNFTVHNGR